MKKDFLFYAGNFDPEINRTLEAYKKGQDKNFQIFKKRSLEIVENILNSEEITTAGKEEWFVVRNLIENIENNDPQLNKILSTYGIPFSVKFSNSIYSV